MSAFFNYSNNQLVTSRVHKCAHPCMPFLNTSELLELLAQTKMIFLERNIHFVHIKTNKSTEIYILHGILYVLEQKINT